MGCDGGTIPRRDELVRTKKKPEQKDKDSDLATKWKHCSISQEKLRHPIMACELGRLYNKESVIEFLLDRSQFEMASNFDHLHGLKDLKELNLTVNPENSESKAEIGDGYIDMQKSDFICPVTGIGMNGRYRFCFIWSCGCVLAERALKEVKSDVCHKCGKKFSENDIVILNSNDEELESERSRMTKRRQQAKLAKKMKSASKHKTATVTSDEPGPSCSKQPKVDEPVDKIIQPKPSSKSSKLTNGQTDKSSKLLHTSQSKNGSIQSDPKASKAYKDLFTTSSAAKNQSSAHWVTYNPMYN